MDIGIFGAGSFGQKHINVINKQPEFNIIGFYDPNPIIGKEIENKFQIKYYKSKDRLMSKCKAIDITCSTDKHFEMICQGMNLNKHIFVEKPICTTNQEIEILKKKYKNYNKVIQVGHIERYNPVINNDIKNLNNISLIKSERNGTLSNRNIKTPITLDLMIHDIDLITNLIKSKIIKIHTEGSANDIVCELFFSNNKKAKLSTKRSESINNKRNMTIYHDQGIVEIDLMNKRRKHIDLNKKVKKWVPEHNTNQLAEEILEFKQNIQLNRKPIVDLEAGCNALEIALEINKLAKI